MSTSETTTTQSSSTDKEEKLEKLSSKSTSPSTPNQTTESPTETDSPAEPATDSTTEPTEQAETSTTTPTSSNSTSTSDGNPTGQQSQDKDLTPTTENQETTAAATEQEVSNTETAVACSTFESFTQYAQAFNDEVQIDIDSSGFKTHSPDPANVALVYAHLHESGFESLTNEESSIGIDIERLSSGVSLFDSDATIKLSERDQGTTQHISDGTLSFNFSHIGLEHLPEKNEIPEFDYSVEMVIDHSKFKQTIDAVDMVGETVRMQTDSGENELTVYCNGDTDSTSQTFSIDGGSSHIRESVDALFSLDYVKDILQAIDSQVEEITIKIGTKKPLKVAVEQEDITAEFLLAPKIEDN